VLRPIKRICSLVITISCLTATFSGAQTSQAPVLSSAVIRGSSVYAAPELFDLYREHLGKPINTAQAQLIASSIADRYVDDGYVRPQIRLEDGLISFGVLRIDILEARISTVSITGNPGPHRERLETMSARLQTDSAIRNNDLQWMLRQMRDLSGLDLTAVTSRDATTVSAYSLDLDAQFRPVSGILRLTNRGTDEIGPNYLLGQIVANAPFGGRTNFGVTFGAATDYEEYRGLGFLANRQIGSEGTRASMRVFRSRSNPREVPVDGNDRYLRDVLTLELNSPLSRDGARTLSLSTALELEDLTILRDDVELRDERLRMLNVSLNGSWKTASDAQYMSVLQAVKGLGGLNSGLDALDLENDARRADFLLFRYSITRVELLSERWSWRFDGFAQHAAYGLPYGQRFKIGGERLGRGFEIAEIAGDQGLGAKVELHRRLRELPAVGGNLSAYGVYDIGAAWKRDGDGRESAATIGLGLRVQASRVFGSLEVAKPLTHADVEGKRDGAVFLEFNYRL
jgi:hemolysin activation/secretion protein